MSRESGFDHSKSSTHHPGLYPDDFTRLCLIGSGHFSKVFLVRSIHSRKYFAMKVMDKASLLLQSKAINVVRERDLLASLSHPFVASLSYAFQTNTQLYLILPFINGGELFGHLSRDGVMTETRVRQYAAEIFVALNYLHRCGVVYRDLKLENVLLDSDGHAVLIDFNFSRSVERGEQPTSFCGTVDYVLLGTMGELPSGYGYGIDFWSLGILVYELLVGLPPFFSQDCHSTYRKILYAPLRFPRRSDVRLSVSCMDFISECLRRNPLDRIDAAGIRSHLWFESYDWEVVENRGLEPEFLPAVSGPSDTKYIDPSFLSSEAALDLPGTSSTTTTASMREKMVSTFVGFSYRREEESDSLPSPSPSPSTAMRPRSVVSSLGSVDCSVASLQSIRSLDSDQLTPGSDVVVVDEVSRIVATFIAETENSSVTDRGDNEGRKPGDTRRKSGSRGRARTEEEEMERWDGVGDVLVTDGELADLEDFLGDG